MQVTGDLDAALTHFRAFFQELDRTFLEREQVLSQVALALLSREHVLLSGPPGTAKSGVVRAVVDRIVDHQTNEPSVFSRQLTESTVQTDLIGPIDFKVLTETGRTEHFTDEGMLGAIHAHLDEVFDGRDMLLRTTLNILHERELKQGTKVTHGAIECALMTSNRYISEVLELSRDNLLAFVDRIAFLAFVPRGFADADALGRVLQARLGQRADPTLGARLTIQDVDVLQSATEAVHFPRELIPRLTQLISLFHDETQSAVRADPTFIPTRYLSTRTAVRLGRLLKAAVVWDRAMNDHTRPMVVSASDFHALSLSMVLAGPDGDALEQLLETETDARERRQLMTVRTEREIFQRCLERLPPPPEPDPATPAADPEIQSARRALTAALSDRESAPWALLEVATELTQKAATSAETEPVQALLDEATTALIERALRGGLSVGAGRATSAGAGPMVSETLDELQALASTLEQAGNDGQRLAHWLRGRAVDLVDRAMSASPASVAIVLPGPDGTLNHMSEVRRRGDAAIERLAGLISRRQRLMALGAKPRRVGESPAQKELSRLGDMLAAAWDGAMVEQVASAFAAMKGDDLGSAFTGLEPLLREVAHHTRALAELGGPRDLVEEVCGPRLQPLLAAAFGRFDAADRPGTADQVDRLLTTLQGAGIGGAVLPVDVIPLAAEALLRAEPPAPARDAYEATYEGYVALREGEERTSLAVALVEVAERLARDGTLPSDPSAIVTLVGSIAPTLRERVLATDLERVDRALRLLEANWANHAKDTSATDQLRAVVTSRFFDLTLDDDVLTRFTLELDLLTQIFPEDAPRVAPLTTRLEVLKAECMDTVVTLVRELSDARFAEVTGDGS